MGVERVVLEGEADIAPARGQVVDALAADQDLAGIGHCQAGQDTHKRGLAAARRPEQAKIFAAGQVSDRP